MDEPLLSVDRLAKALDVPRSWVYSRSRETGPNAMPKIKCGKYCRFVLEDVLKWLREQD